MPLKIVNNHNATVELFKAVSNDDHVNAGDISVTTLIDNPRVKILKDTHEYEQDVMDMVFMQIGTAFHSMMEENTFKYRDFYFLRIAYKILKKLDATKLANDLASFCKERFADEIVGKEVFIERTITIDVTVTSRITGKVHTVKLSGTQDYYNKTLKKLRDYKVTSTSMSSSDQKHWIQQQNIYAYMLRHHGEEVESIEINAFYRNWSLFKTFFDKTKKYPKQPFERIALPVWTDAECKKYIESRVLAHVEAKESDKLPLCSVKERWASDDVFTVFDGDKMIKSFYNMKQAKDFAESGDVTIVQPRITMKLSESPKCDHYCPVSKFCDQKIKRDKIIEKQKQKK